MSTQTALGHSFPTPCKRCGGALYRQVDYCPYCGAVHPLDTGPHTRTTIPGSRAGATNQAARKFDDAPPLPDEADLTAHAVPLDEAVPAEAAPHTSLVSPDTPIPPLDELPFPQRKAVVTARRVLFAIAAVVVIGLAYVAYALFSGGSDSEDVGTDQTADVTQDARTTTGTIAPFAPTQPAHPAAAAKAVNLDSPAKSTPVVPAAPVAPQVAIAPPVAAPVATAPVKPATQFRDAAQALQAARLAFHANDLSTAQAALGAAQALQPGNADVQHLATELQPLIARRDSALQAAQTCVAQQSWPCARTHANDALAIDTGNDTAKSILERVIRETGWAPLKLPAGTFGQAQGK